jgi:hypothetical protein
MAQTSMTKPKQDAGQNVEVEQKALITKENIPQTQRAPRSAVDVNRSYAPFLRTAAKR